jgi:putative flippase GtrA
MARFWVVTLLGWVVNVACVEGAVAIGLHYQVGVAISLVVAPTFNFVGHRWWTFRSA